MTIKEGRELRNQLQTEIENGIDVEFNTKWIELLNMSILKAVEKGYSKLFKKNQQHGTKN